MSSGACFDKSRVGKQLILSGLFSSAGKEYCTSSPEHSRPPETTSQGVATLLSCSRSLFK